MLGRKSQEKNSGNIFVRQNLENTNLEANHDYIKSKTFQNLVRYNLTPLEWLQLKKKKKVDNYKQGGGEIQTLVCCLWDIKWFSHCGK